MLIALIIGLLSAIAIPKFADMVMKAKEASVLGKLGTFRSALAIYYSNTEGEYPDSATFGHQFMERVLVPKYLDEIPKISIPQVPSHVPGNKVFQYGAGPMPAPGPGPGGADIHDKLWDTQGVSWFYTRSNGKIVVNCDHTNTKGNVWSGL